MKKRNKQVASTEEMEFTFLPETTEEQTAALAENLTPENEGLQSSAEEIAEETPEFSAASEADTADEASAEEPTPADEPPSADKPKKKEKSILAICLPLVIICIGVALMLAAVNALTRDTIAAQAAAEKERAVIAIFPDATSAKLHETTEDGEIYLAIRDNTLIGACISLASGGFAGDISMMVGRTTANEICGVQIIAMSESPGIGTKTKGEAFLSQYRGGDLFVIGTNVDAIAGATISSRAVTAGVNRALELPLDFEIIAMTHGLIFDPYIDNTPVTSTPTDTDIPESMPVEDTAAPAEESDTQEPAGEETESTSSLLTLPAISAAAAVNRVILVSTTTVTKVETEAEDTTAPDTAESTDTDTSADTTDNGDSEAADSTSDTTDNGDSEDADSTSDTEDTTGIVDSETATPTDTEIPSETDTSNNTDSVESAETESDSDTAAA